MRLKTFISAYVLFLCIMFSIISIISVYMTRSQMGMLKEQSIREYETISGTLARDIQQLYAHGGLPGMDLDTAVETFMLGFVMHYRRHGIDLRLTDITVAADPLVAEISVVQAQNRHYIRIAGVLPEPFHLYQLDYYFNITDSIASVQSIQRALLFFAVIFSAITALALYFIVQRIFRPLGVIDITSREIASGNYGERIHIRGNNELSSMAASFNQMAEEVEKQMRILADEAKSKQQFIDNFSHEIRTPLTAISGYGEYILSAPFNEDEVMDSAKYIVDKANHMKTIADSLLKLATLRNYKPTIDKLPVANIFDNVHQTLKKTLHKGNTQLLCKAEASYVHAQEDLIKIMLINLCHNAIKSCPPGGTVTLESTNHSNTTVISVTDNGHGIPADSLDKVTEAFYRTDAARGGRKGGVGLGLTLCKQIAEVHGAGMQIFSTEGVGTQVKITFTTP